MGVFSYFASLILPLCMLASFLSGNVSISTGALLSPATNSIFVPFIHTNSASQTTPANAPIHAVRVQYNNYSLSRAEVAAMSARLQKAHVNLVGLAAGRVEWAYFKWADHPEYTSGDVKDTGVDFLAADSAAYGQFAAINAVIDVFSPNYIAAHPDTAAINALGQRNPDLVGTMDLVNGEYGQLLLQQVQYIAAHYPKVNSISITELSYRLDGYGPKELAAYKAYTGKTDWPRQSNGQINIDDYSIGDWRSHVLGAYFKKLTDAAHAYGKQLYLDVCLNPDHLDWQGNEKGTRYDLMLSDVDKLIVWGYYYLENYPPEFLQTAAQSLAKYGSSRVIMSIGMWGPTSALMPTDLLQRGLTASQNGGIPNLWITPSIYMNDSLWGVLDNFWK
jgi:hypothetical protein